MSPGDAGDDDTVTRAPALRRGQQEQQRANMEQQQAKKAAWAKHGHGTGQVSAAYPLLRTAQPIEPYREYSRICADDYTSSFI